MRGMRGWRPPLPLRVPQLAYQTYPHIPDGRDLTWPEAQRNAQRLAYLAQPEVTPNPNNVDLLDHPGPRYCTPCRHRGDWKRTMGLDWRDRPCCGDCFVAQALTEYRSP